MPARQRCHRLHAGGWQRRSRHGADLERRRSSAACRTTSSVDVAYVGARGSGGWASVDINAPLTLGGGDASRPYASMGRIQPSRRGDSVCGTRYDSMQSLSTSRSRAACWSRAPTRCRKSMNDHDEDGRADARPGTRRVRCGAIGVPRDSIDATISRWPSPTSCRGRAVGSYDNVFKAVVQDWQINGMFAAFSGTPFQIAAAGTSLDTAAEHAAGQPRRRRSTCLVMRRQRRLVRYHGVSQPTNVRLRQHHPESVLRYRAGRTSTSRCSVRSRSAVRAGLKRAFRRTISSTGSSSPIRRTTSRRARSARSPASRATRR